LGVGFYLSELVIVVGLGLSLLWPHPVLLYAGLGALALAAVLGWVAPQPNDETWAKEVAGKNRKLWVDQYRGALLFLTALAILGVDFPLFPRRFAKTETYGQSVVLYPSL
jgi:hypothetical protein